MKPAQACEIDDPGPALTDADLAGLERFLGARLPPDYRAFLAQHNGGKPRKSAFPIPTHPEGSIDLELFFGVTRGEARENLEWNYRTHRKALGKNLLPIGRTPANDLVALVLAGDKRNGVVFYDAIEDDPAKRLHDVADDFLSFLSSLAPG